MLIETSLRKQLGLKVHAVTKVEETESLGSRLLRCGLCRQRCRKVHSMQIPRLWRDLSMRKLPLTLRHRPRRLECPRVERRVLLWVGDDRTEEAVRPFFTKELGTDPVRPVPPRQAPQRSG